MSLFKRFDLFQRKISLHNPLTRATSRIKSDQTKLPPFERKFKNIHRARSPPHSLLSSPEERVGCFTHFQTPFWASLILSYTQDSKAPLTGA